MTQAGPLALAALAANGANAVVTVLLARLLNNHGYGSLAQLTGLFLVVSMPGSAVIVAVVRRVTGAAGDTSPGAVRRWAVRLHARGTLAVAAFAVVVIALRNQINGQLSSPNATGVWAVLIAGAVWVLLSLDRGLLQAHREYRTLAVNVLVEGGTRVVAVLCLVGVGFGVAGAAIGVLVSELATAMHARVAADRVWSTRSRAVARWLRSMSARDAGRALRAWWAEAFGAAPTVVVASRERAGILVDLLVALPALALIALLQNVDVIVLARDNPRASGTYAAISVVSKALVFAAVMLGGYLLPEAAIRWREGNHALRQLGVTLLLLGLPAVVLLLVAAVAPHAFLSLVFSDRYAGASTSLAVLVLAMICLSLTVTLTMYLLAVGSRFIVGVLLAGSAAAAAAVAAANGAPAATAGYDLAVQAALAAVTCAGFVTVHRRRAARAP
jgi:O-antigen/teichoic acid export membrane protein